MVAFLCDRADNVERVYGAGRRRRIEELARCHGEIVTTGNIERHAPDLGEVEAVFSTWGMPVLSEGQFACLPKLRAVFFAAGSVQGFARPYLERGITVVSAWAANAIPVAEYTLAQILLANKGYFRNTREARLQIEEANAFVGAGNFETTVALLGAGQIGRKVIELLRGFALSVVVFDPFLTEAEAARAGVVKVSLEEAFRLGNVTSNYCACAGNGRAAGRRALRVHARERNVHQHGAAFDGAGGGPVRGDAPPPRPDGALGRLRTGGGSALS